MNALTSLKVAILCITITTSATAATYPEVRKSGVNYLIASLAIESIKKTECRYVLKDSILKPYIKVRSEVENNLSSTDRKEFLVQLTKLEQQIDADIKAQLHEFRAITDEKTACGMLSSFAINKFLESESDWHKKLSN